MYTPKDFKVEDTWEAHALMRAHPFAILVTQGTNGVVATHLPTVLKIDDGGGLGHIECHLARPNPQWRTFAGDAEALLIFQGAEAYIRPGWYPSKTDHGKAVPTWNYAVVHAYGRLEVVQDQAWLLAHVAELSRQQEAPYTSPWSTSDAPENYLAMLARGIVGLKLAITRLEGKAKMSQNREARDRAGVVAGLSERAEGQDAATAALVAKLMV
ncbi:MAG: FMN-binding negative transcriptional regulator [Hyphomicrobiaceae bacterium]